jgi:hypothetical protein
MFKVKELRAGDWVIVRQIILDSRAGDILPGTVGRVVKVVDGFAPDHDRFDRFRAYDEQTVRESRGHTQIVKVKFSRRRFVQASGYYFKKRS